MVSLPKPGDRCYAEQGDPVTGRALLQGELATGVKMGINGATDIVELELLTERHRVLARSPR